MEPKINILVKILQEKKSKEKKLPERNQTSV